MTPTCTLNSVALPLYASEGVQIEETPVGASRRMLSGALRVDYRATKRKITIPWVGLTATERGTLRTAWLGNIATPQVLVLADGQSVTVMAAANAWTESHWYDLHDVPYYDVNCVFEEQ